MRSPDLWAMAEQLATIALINSWKTATFQFMARGTDLYALSDDALQMHVQAGRWSILECVEHLNLYGQSYLPAMATAIRASRSNPVASFHPGWLGGWMARSMAPLPGASRMKTFQKMDPKGKELHRTTIGKYLDQQQEMLRLLELAMHKNLNQVKVPLAFAPMIKIRLGDAFQFMVNHQERHWIQIAACMTQ